MIRLEDYFRRVESIQTQYNYAREAIMGFMTSKYPTKALKPKTSERMVPLSSFASGSDPEFIKQLTEYVESLKGGFPDDKKDLENRLAQNEIILLVAVFEDMLKSIHREMLHQNPKLLSPDVKINLGKLAALGENAIIAEEIERAVKSLDYENVKARAKAFEKIGLSWNGDVERVEHILNLRNEILHQDMNKHVSGWDLTLARSLVLTLPLHLCWEGNRLYPDAFETTLGKIKHRNKRLKKENNRER
jgi:hypothetical protein